MKYFIFVFLFLTQFFLKAQNNVRIFSDDGEMFLLIVFDSLQHETPQASLLIRSVYEDTLRVKIEFNDKIKHEAVLFLLEKGKPTKNREFNYKLHHEKTKISLEYMANYNIVNLPKPLVPLKPVVDTMERYRNTHLGHFCELKDGKPIYYNNIPKDNICISPMPNDYLNYINFLMQKAQVDDDKYIIAENVCRNNCLLTEQLNFILKYLGYELEKLKLIKIAYYNLTDKNNKKELEKSFRFESSISELNSFLKTAEAQKISTASNCKTAASDDEIKQMVEELKIYTNDSQRFDYFKKIYENLCYSTAQITTILKLFIHDREKFDSAKMLYFRCVNKNEFANISDVFSYNETISELKNFIAKQKD